MSASQQPYTAAGASSIELDLLCERERWTTVHRLSWVMTGHPGRPSAMECVCTSCPHGANTRPWPTKLELQDAGAPPHVPRLDEPARSPYSLFR